MEILYDLDFKPYKIPLKGLIFIMTELKLLYIKVKKLDDLLKTVVMVYNENEIFRPLI